MSKNKVIITPITFMKDHVLEDEKVNELFTEPYMSKTAMDFTHSYIMDGLKCDYPECINDRYNEFKYRIKSINFAALRESIMSYLQMNISDMVYSILYSYITDVFEATADNTGVYVHEAVVHNAKKIVEDVWITHLQTYDIEHNTNDFEMQYIKINSMMDIIYSNIVNNIYDQYIVNIVNRSIADNSIQYLYKGFYYLCYGKEPEEEITIDKAYVFCTTLMREKMIPYCIQLRESMIAISQTVATMITNAPMYYSLENIENPNYNTQTMVYEEQNVISDNIPREYIEIMNSSPQLIEQIEEDECNGCEVCKKEPKFSFGRRDFE